MLGGVFWYGIHVYEKKTGQVADFFNSEKADEHFEKGELNLLIDYCGKFESKYPNDVHVNWYLGIANYNLGNLDSAKMYLEKVASINPNWKKNVIGYLDEIDLITKTTCGSQLQ